MADEQTIPIEPAIATSAKPKNGGKKLAFVIVAAIFALGCGWLYVQGQSAKSKAPESDTKVFTVIHLDPFVTNLTGVANENSYLRLTIDLSVEKDQAESEKKETDTNNPNKIPVAQLRDVVLQVIAARTVEELSTVDGKSKLKADLLTAVQEKAPQAGIHEIYFTDFLIQR